MSSEERRYRLISILGHGSSSDVWLAEDALLKRKVVLKFLALGPGLQRENPELAERFRREARAAGRLSHPNIVTVYDFGEMDGRPYISMEFVEGGTLTKTIARGPLPLNEAVSIIAQICRALDYAHSQGIIHRDIKPANVFLASEGLIKVADFGIARMAGSSTLTQEGTIIGTPGYMSPEQIRGVGADARSDIFSCGIILFELLTGIQPFDSDSIASAMYKVINHPLPPLQSLRPDLPAWVDAVVQKACAKNPSERYQSAGEFLADLESCGTRAMSATTTRVTPFADAATPMTAVVAPPDHGDRGGMPTLGSTVPSGPYAHTLVSAGRTVGLPHATQPFPQYQKVPLAAPGREKRRLTAVLIALLVIMLLVGGAAAAFFLLHNRDSVIIPDLKSMDWESARAKLESAGLAARKEEVQAVGHRENEVVSQDPEAGQRVSRGTTVTVEVALGSQEPRSAGSIATSPTVSPSSSEYFDSKSKRIYYDTYTNSTYRYRISYPSSWNRQEGAVSYGYRARFDSPDGKAYIVVDTTFEDHADPGSWAKSQDRTMQGKSGYNRTKLEYSTFKGWRSFIWEFSAISSESGFHQGETVVKYDYFINTDNIGYAVLFSATPDVYYSNLDGFINKVLNSLEIY